MFKYLLLKSIYDLSDIDVVERSKYDMSFKYFLDMAPEEAVINPSSLTKFRKLRLKDMNLLDMLIAKTVRIALEKGIIKSKSIIVDATHTKSRYNQKTPRQALLEQSKKLRRAVYEIDESMKKLFPAKNTEDSLEKELEYCHALISVIKGKDDLCSYPKVEERLNLLEESVKDDLEHIETSRDADAKYGSGKGIVNKKRQTLAVGKTGKSFDVQNAERGVGQCFAKNQFCIRTDGLSNPLIAVILVHKGRFDAETAQY